MCCVPFTAAKLIDTWYFCDCSWNWDVCVSLLWSAICEQWKRLHLCCFVAAGMAAAFQRHKADTPASTAVQHFEGKQEHFHLPSPGFAAENAQHTGPSAVPCFEAVWVWCRCSCAHKLRQRLRVRTRALKKGPDDVNTNLPRGDSAIITLCMELSISCPRSPRPITWRRAGWEARASSLASL